MNDELKKRFKRAEKGNKVALNKIEILVNNRGKGNDKQGSVETLG